MNGINFQSEGHRLVHERLENLVKPGYKLLDVGCGDGSFLDRLGRNYDIRGLGVDPSATVKGNTDTNCTRLRAEEVDELQEKFDLVYSINSLHHFDDPSSFLNSAKDSLRDPGKLILADWKEGASTGIPENYYSQQDVVNLLEQTGFNVTDSSEIEKQFLLVAELFLS